MSPLLRGSRNQRQKGQISKHFKMKSSDPECKISASSLMKSKEINKSEKLLIITMPL
jgi:hypothetical protein